MFIRLQLTKKQRIVAHNFFNTSFLEPQKPDFSQKKATKVDDHQAPRSQRSKKIWLGNYFLFVQITFLLHYLVLLKTCNIYNMVINSCLVFLQGWYKHLMIEFTLYPLVLTTLTEQNSEQWTQVVIPAIIKTVG